MSDPRRPGGSDPNRRGWSQPTEQLGNHNPYPDPAYAGQYNYPGYGPPNHTEQLPPYWTQTQQPMPAPEPPEPPRSPRWLWLAAAAAVLLVVGMVIALVIADTNSKQDTVVAPLPPLQQEPALTTPPTTTSRAPVTSTAPPTSAPSTTGPSTSVPLLPPTSAVPGVSESVVYTVDGEGRAISITYVDSGGVLQMEFNVVLPWTKEVSLTAPASGAASVTVLNVGREVTCTVSVDGLQVRERTGTGLTICASIG